ncbi:hypothetical protein [Nocardia brasiliensis]|uniref:hypothetical protein n=1 Tax=Nocardia brasiliensis TaxID=37326 RepID=UPI00245820EE|nr:hypothetical protein [Nocardia brasiliensis]
MSATSSETNRTDNEDTLWQALNANPMATTAELSAIAGIGASSARKILARWGEDNTATRHADGAGGPHRWTVATGDAVTPPAPAPARQTAPDTDIAAHGADTPPAEPAADIAPPADVSDEPEPAPEAADDATSDDADPAELPDDEPESPFGAPSPIAVGDEVANRYHRSWRGRVTEMRCQDGIAQCIIETPDGAQSSIPPWALVPAAPDGVPEDWQQQMDMLVTAQRDRVVHELRDRSTTAREHLEDLSQRLDDIAAALGTGTIAHDNDEVPIANSVGELEDAMVELDGFRDLVAESGLLTVDEIKRATASHAATRYTPTQTSTRTPGTSSTTANHSTADKLPPGGLRGMVEDALHDNPGRSFTTTQLKHVMDAEYRRNISSGAISNALDKLTAQGIARRIGDTPRTWALAENP